MSAAKKTPQKKTPAKATQASTAKKIAKKAEKTLPKKGARKKATTKLASDKKKKTTTAKKTPAVTRRLRKKPAEKKSKQNAASKKSAEIVNVPRNVPLRSIEKAEVLRTELSLSWQKSMHTIAYVGGLCFLLVGAAFASSNVFGNSLPVQNNALVSSATTEVLESKLTLQSSVPTTLNEPTKVLFTLTNVYPESVQYYLIHQDTKVATPKRRVNNLLENKYSFLIDPQNLEPGQYRVFVQYTIKELTGTIDTKKTEAVATFTKPQPVTEAVVEQSSVPENSEEQLASETENAETPVAEEESEVIQPVIEPVIEPIIKPDSVKEISEPVASSTVLEPKPAGTFALYAKETTVSGVLIISSLHSDGYRNLELYARPITSLSSRFLTRVSERLGKQVFIVNTELFLPNGTYEFYARGIDVSGKEKTTPSVLLTVKNIVTVPPIAVSPIQSDSTVDSASELLPQRERDFAPFNLAINEGGSTTRDAVKDASDRFLKRDAATITTLLQNYASARQSGDEILITAARKTLMEKKVELANAALVDKELAGISDDVISRMSEKLADLQNRIDTFEQIRKEKSGGQSANDSDGDGIPDYDEINLYKTDPNKPDTDGDGFADGVEIIRGFDPLDDTAEVAIEYESPKESVGLIREEEFVVSEVIPVINTIAENDDTDVLTEIRGRGLPNSFVTLYIFSSPTIVTIKTDADGSFVYTLDKELEDGSHDVFVALTDNTGSIVAQSNPFSFVKEAQAFTPVDAAGGDVVSSDTVVQSVSKNSYNAVIGLGVLAFGLILIMLGISLRTKEEEVVLASGRITGDDLSGTDGDKKLDSMTA